MQICHFYTEIVKFGLILTHLKLFGGKLGGGKKIFFWENAHTPLWHRYWVCDPFIDL